MNKYNSFGTVSFDDIDYSFQKILEGMMEGRKHNNRFYKTYSGKIKKSLSELDISSEDFNIKSTFKYNVDLYDENGLYISKLKYDVDDNGNLIPKEGFKLEGNYYVSIIEYPNYNYNLFNHYDAIGVAINEPITMVKIPYDNNIITDTPLYFDLYVDGKYISQNKYDIASNNIHDKIIIFKSNNDAIPSGSEIVFSFIASYTKHFEIVKYDYDEINTIKDCYRVDMNVSTIWENNKQIVRLFNEGVNVSPEKYHISKGILAIYNIEDYLPIDKVRTVSMRQYILRTQSSDNVVERFNVEEFFVKVDRQSDSPIPIVDYNDDKHDILLFKTNGLYVNDAKLFIKDGQIHYYKHDIGLDEGDRLNFVVLNDDETLSTFAKFVECREDGQMSLGIPIKYDPSKMSFLLFRSEGSYVSNSRYDINLEENIIEFKMDLSIEAGDRFEFLFMEYKSINSTTAHAIKKVDVNFDNQQIFEIPFKTYDKQTDTLILLRNDGMLIGNNRYSINDDNTITLSTGSPLYDGMWIDFLIVRKLKRPYPVDYLNSIGGVE